MRQLTLRVPTSNLQILLDVVDTCDEKGSRHNNRKWKRQRHGVASNDDRRSVEDGQIVRVQFALRRIQVAG